MVKRHFGIVTKDFKLVKKFGVELVYPSYAELAADPQVDAIYIATPHPFHFDNARLVLEAGKPVLIEKPITVNAAEAKGLFDLAAGKEVLSGPSLASATRNLKMTAG